MIINHQKVNSIQTREDFIEVLKDLVKSIRNGAPIENSSLDSYIEGVIAWVEDMDGYYESLGIASEVKLDTMNWRVLADILVAATMYE